MNKWHKITFKIRWDRQSPPKFFIDLLIIDLLINPTVEKFKSSLGCWTFHRSADRKHEDGHMLKFNFYTNPVVANKILNDIKSSEDYSRIKYLFEETGIELKDAGTEIMSISDGGWPIEIQKSWPYYIMGCCEMYIKFMEEVIKNNSNNIDKNNLEQLEGFYKEINEKITKKWRNSGQHAFFHHLEAIFGYEATLLLCKLGDQDMILPFRASRTIFPEDN